MYELFSKRNCPITEKTVALLNKHGRPFQVYQVNREITEWEVFDQFPLSDTLPIITKDGTMIGSSLCLLSHLME